MTTEQRVALVQGQLEAYNARDIEKFCSFYHADVAAYRLGQDVPFMMGMEAFRKSYGEKFKNTPDLHCTLKSRIVLNGKVLDEESVVPSGSHVVAIYDFKDGLIKDIWFVY
ncbi:hypothetical protein Bb109J_c0302 [Bdellovibrio bacteriovorus]|uniref:nuclear transport factor 2 family protein n=1 Tax=Bdellovibrio bacteriovorus TaxID=959 RepID=UPI00045C197C|nr:nuclear transport factor 2 family protein [Bdellovibrio bacteriovorus]AHZ85960.1 steroid delta-isomerase [Bdellovibrio bacteriovorus]BEV66882.1 hypothetical protein Bb109J_c0302 [Bdellovibrio bacteriovorus]